MTDGEVYLKMYPKLSKWMNRCIVCQDFGYKPELPLELSIPGGDTSAGAKNLRKYFKPLQVNEMGLCDVCKKYI